MHAYKIAEGKLTSKCCINISGVYKNRVSWVELTAGRLWMSALYNRFLFVSSI